MARGLVKLAKAAFTLLKTFIKQFPNVDYEVYFASNVVEYIACNNSVCMNHTQSKISN